MRGRIFYSLFLIFGSDKALGSIDSVIPKTEPIVLTAQSEDHLSEIEKEMNRARKNLTEKIKIFHRIQNAAKAPAYVWQNSQDKKSKQAQALPYLKFEIREILRKIDSLQIRKEEVKYESELQQIGNFPKNEISSFQQSNPFLCTALPSNPTSDEPLVVDQGFGLMSDKETGLKWKSSGWWVRRGEGWVRACADGKIAFEGIVQGRGRVVMIDHGKGVLSLYANLSDSLDADSPNRKGKPIKAGDIIGPVAEKFYFEVRQGGVPVDPKLVLSRDSLTKIAL